MFSGEAFGHEVMGWMATIPRPNKPFAETTQSLVTSDIILNT